MKLKILLAVLALALAQLVPAASAEEAPRYAEGEAIVVMRGESGASAAASAKNAAGQSLGLAEGSVIQYFNPIKEDETQTSAASRAASAENETLTVVHMRAPEGMTTEEFIEKLRAEPNVVSAMPNYIMQAQSVTPDDEHWAEQWGPAAIRAPELWERGTGSEEVVVAVIDSGVIYDHPDLAGNMYTFDEAAANAIISENPDMLTGDVPLAGSHGAWFHSEISLLGLGTPHTGVPIGPQPTMQGDEDEQWYIDSGTMQEMSRIGDVEGHGTHVAGIIGAVGNNARGVAGINWKVRIMAVNVFSSSIFGGRAETSDIIRGIDFVVAAKRAGVNIRAANISLGGWFSPSEMEGSAYDYKIKELSDAGILVCMAAGNDGQNIDAPTDGMARGQRFYPASFRHENTLSVGALMRNADGTLAPDTPGNGGIGYSDYSSSGEWVDIFAPGTAIYSTCRTTYLLNRQTFDESGYISASGTSMAAPHVTGAAALLASLMPEKSASEIKQMILDGADGSTAREGFSRYGALDVYEAWNGFAEQVDTVEPDEEHESVTPIYAQIAKDETALRDIFSEGDLREYGGCLYLDAGIAKKAAMNVRADKTVEDIALFPVFAADSAELADNPLGAVAFMVGGGAFGDGSTLADIAICKVKPDGSALEYKEADASPGGGTFTVTEADGAALSGPFDAGKKYIITLFIEDNGDYDLDAAAGSIVDPTAIVSYKKPEAHGSGGGCSAVSGAAALLALVGLPLIARRKR